MISFADHRFKPATESDNVSCIIFKNPVHKVTMIDSVNPFWVNAFRNSDMKSEDTFASEMYFSLDDRRRDVPLRYTFRLDRYEMGTCMYLVNELYAYLLKCKMEHFRTESIVKV